MIHWTAAVLTLGGLLMVGGGIGLIQNSSKKFQIVPYYEKDPKMFARCFWDEKLDKMSDFISLKLPTGDLLDYYMVQQYWGVELNFLGKFHFQDQDCPKITVRVPPKGRCITMSFWCTSDRFDIIIPFHTVNTGVNNADYDFGSFYMDILRKTDISKWVHNENTFKYHKAIDFSQEWMTAITNNKRLELDWVLQIEKYVLDKIATTQNEGDTNLPTYRDFRVGDWWQGVYKNEYTVRPFEDEFICDIGVGKMYAIIYCHILAIDYGYYIIPYSLVTPDSPEIPDKDWFSQEFLSLRFIYYIFDSSKTDKSKIIELPNGREWFVLKPLYITTEILKILGVELP